MFSEWSEIASHIGVSRRRLRHEDLWDGNLISDWVLGSTISNKTLKPVKSY
jgi:hypothetical protein